MVLHASALADWPMTSDDLARFLGDAWSVLERGVADRRSPARHPTLATVSPDGLPQARTVVMRAVQRDCATVEVHSDARADKVGALQANPNAAVHIWHPRQKLQVRLACRVSISLGPEVEDRWQRVPEASRVAYGATPAPGTPIQHPQAYEVHPELDTFAVLSCQIDEIDLLHLGAFHRRARFNRSDNWAGEWRVP